MAVTNPMRDIYSRLKPLGFDSGFVHEFLLPDWWDDDLGNVPANRAIAEATISRHLKISIKTLSDPNLEPWGHRHSSGPASKGNRVSQIRWCCVVCK